MMEFISTLFINIVPFLIVLTALVFVHELGHYLVARRNGVRVEVFSIGFGPRLFGWKSSNGTHWKVSAIPLGGYIKMVNEDELFATEKEGAKPDAKSVSPDSLLAKTVWQRIAISAAGPGANYLFAFLLLSFLYASYGQKVPAGGAIIAGTQKGSVAEQAGLLKEDQIIAADGKEIKDVEDLQKAIASHPEQEMTLKVLRKSEHKDILMTLRPAAVEVGGKRVGRLGVELAPIFTTVVHNPLGALKYAAIDTVNVTVATLQSLGQMLIGARSADGLTGPIGIATLTGRVAKHGLGELMMLAALLSINLGLINLFPVPVLDGGHIFLYLIEAIRGKPVTAKIQEIAFKIGFVLILGLILFSFWNDLSRLKFFQWLLGLFH